MFKQNPKYTSKLVDLCFITGVNYENLKRYIETKESEYLTPECLLCFPSGTEQVSPGIFDFVFPTGIKLSYSEESPKFYSIVLTNEKGERSYVYILRITEKIEYHENEIEIKTATEKLQQNIEKVNLSENFTKMKEDTLTALTDRSKQLKKFYTPLAICILSQVANTDAFKEILHEGYRIITHYHSNTQMNLSESQLPNSSLNYAPSLDNYKFCALLNYFIFINNIVHPPNFSKITLNFLNSSVDFKFSSKFELPASDSNIKNLFDCLEISIIIKLWCAILTEERIIIIANQSYLLYSICEALIKLIFPFKWLHTYIPIVPSSKIEFLETPTPFIMGVLSSTVDYQQLLETFPSHVICNVDTSEIHAESIVTLPRIEEVKLRKKLQFVRNPDIFDMEEIIKNPLNKTLIEDINPHRAFSENVQYIFFRIFRNSLSDFEKNYLDSDNNKFDPAKFLEDISLQSENYKLFWGKVIFTIAFEHFIEFNNYLDESNTELFKRIVKSNTESILCGYFNLNYKLTKNDLNNFLEDIKELHIIQKAKEKDGLDGNTSVDSKFIENLERCISDYNFFYNKEFSDSNPNINNQKSGNSNQVSSFSEKKHRNRDKNLSSDAGLFSSKKFGIFSDYYDSSRGNNCNLKFDDEEINLNNNYINSTQRHEGKYYCLKILSNKELTGNCLNFYPNTSTNKGFIEFIGKINDFISRSKPEMEKLDITEIGMKNQLIKKLKEEIFRSTWATETFHGKNNDPFETSDSLPNTGNSFYSTAGSNFNLASSTNLIKKKSLEFVEEIAESESENHSEQGSNSNSRRSTLNRNTTNINNINCNSQLFLNASYIPEQERFSTSTNLNQVVNHEQVEEILSFDRSETFQYCLYMAYLIEEIILKNSNSNKISTIPFSNQNLQQKFCIINKEERNLSISKLFEYFEKAFFLSKEEFPKNRYRAVLSQYSTLDKLKECKMRITNEADMTNITNMTNFNVKTSKIQKNDLNISDFIWLIIETQYRKLKKENEKNGKISIERKIPSSTPITPKNLKSSFSNLIKNSPIISNERSETDYDDARSRNHSKETKKSNFDNLDRLNSYSFSLVNTEFRKGNTSVLSSKNSGNSPFSKTCSFLKMQSNEIKDEIKKRKVEKRDSDSHKKSGSSSNENADENENQKNPFKLAQIKAKSNEQIGVKPCFFLNFFKYKNKSKNQEGKAKDKESLYNPSSNSTTTFIKNMIINNFIKVSKCEIDPLVLTEDICFKLFSLVDKFNLNKNSCDLLSRKKLQEVADSEMFSNIKETVCELQKVNITKILHIEGKICFWLNLFNFLTLFTVILKNEILNTQYEWIKFLKNSYFNIGGWKISLFEIQNCILINKYCKFMYGEDTDFSFNDVRRKFKIDLNENKNNYLILFGIYLPTKSSVNLKIYLPETLYYNLKENVMEYIFNFIDCNNSSCIAIPELVNWFDNEFVNNIQLYKEMLDSRVYKYVTSNNRKKIEVVKFSWKVNFFNILSWEVYKYKKKILGEK